MPTLRWRALLVIGLILALLPRAAADDTGGLVVSEPPVPEDFNPYTKLGLTCGASETMIKRSGRSAKRAAKTEEEKELVQIASDILTDVGRKSRWDLAHPCGEEKNIDEEDL